MRSGGGRGGREEGELAVHGHCKKKPSPSLGGQIGPKDGVAKNKKRQERMIQRTVLADGLAGGRVNQSRRDLEKRRELGGW